MNEQELREKLTMFRMFDFHKTVVYKTNKYFVKDGYGLQVEQFPVLMIPFFKGALSQQEIADISLRDKSSIQRSVISLTGKGFLVTAQDPFDKRKKMVQLTKEGRKLAEQIAKELIKIDDMIFSCLTDEEKASLNAILAKCEKRVATL